MKDFQKGHFKAVISEIVIAELEDAPDNVKKKFIELLMSQPERIELTDEALDLADNYQKRKILTSKFYNDGLHIALATVAMVDVLVSWNFKHIVRWSKIRLFNAVNLERGYKPLQIYSPREVTTYGIK